MNRSSLWSLLAASGLGLVLTLGGCGKASSEPSLGGETHWLQSCGGGESCGAGLECLCGVCTVACEDDAGCASVGDGASCAVSTASSRANFCDLQAPPRLCLSATDQVVDSPFGWLQSCAAPNDPECAAGLECICGVCTIACSDDASCSGRGGDAFCALRATSRRQSICDSQAPDRVCLSASDEASSFSVVEGSRYDARGCFQASRVAGTTTQACVPFERFARDPSDGSCWRFPNGCAPDNFLSLSTAVLSMEACATATDLCPDSLSCNDRHVATVEGCLTCDETRLQRQARANDLSTQYTTCSSDQDCVLVPPQPGCNDGCATALNRNYVDGYQRDELHLINGYCSDSKWQSLCTPFRPQCPAQGAFCRAGQCTSVGGLPTPCAQRNLDNCEDGGACRLARAYPFVDAGQCFSDQSVAVGCLELEQSCPPVTTPALAGGGNCYLFGDCLPAGFERAPEGQACSSALGTTCAP